MTYKHATVLCFHEFDAQNSKGGKEGKSRPLGKGLLEYEGFHYPFASYRERFRPNQKVVFRSWRALKYDNDVAEAVDVRNLNDDFTA